MAKKIQKCVICKETFKGFGNNPLPVKLKGRCCDKCNDEVVIPTRLFMSTLTAQ